VHATQPPAPASLRHRGSRMTIGTRSLADGMDSSAVRIGLLEISYGRGGRALAFVLGLEKRADSAEPARCPRAHHPDSQGLIWICGRIRFRICS
jgi:hypothetical protein